MKKILLTFDIEEFDLPREYGVKITDEQMYRVSKEGLFNIINLLRKYNLKATFFVTANFAKEYSNLVKELDEEGHEIASHGYNHSFSKQSLNDIKSAKQEKEKVIKKIIRGYRSPRFNTDYLANLSDLGFSYDSSIHPTFIPGRYNNFFKPRGMYKIGEITEIPPSVLPIVRLPIFWLAFKNFPAFYSKIFTRINFYFSDYLMLVFHSWEFADLEKIDIPKFIKRKHSQKMLNSFENYVTFAKNQGYSFETVAGFLKMS